MKKFIASTALTFMLAAGLPAALASAQVISPESNKSVSGSAHTNLEIKVLPPGTTPPLPPKKVFPSSQNQKLHCHCANGVPTGSQQH